MEDVTRNQLAGVDDPFLAVPQHPGVRSGQALQRLQRPFGLALLHHAHDGVEHHDEQDQRRLKKARRIALHNGDDEGDGGGREQDENHHILKLF